jgi:hypothetical protein
MNIRELNIKCKRDAVSTRVLHGGSWPDFSVRDPADKRFHTYPGLNAYTSGFRLVLKGTV